MSSPELPVYRKGEVLYDLGVNRNAIGCACATMVVEEYMDVVALATAGAEGGVAALGTSLTDGQA